MTIKVCVPLIGDSENFRVSNIKLASNYSIALKPATLCIDVKSFEFSDNVQLNTSDISAVYYEAYVQHIFNDTKLTKEYFLNEMSWAEDFRFVIHEYLASLKDIESWSGKTYLDIIRRSGKDESLPVYFTRKGKDLFMAFLQLEERLNLLDICVNELRSKLGLEVRILFSQFNSAKI